jgi:phosphoglycolate phosphatase-like HAD superfamily hydrolase
MTLPLRAVLFDMDGTLLDTAPDMWGGDGYLETALDLVGWLDASSRV